ncbi:extracellular solute-binding protein [Streptomyces armeniacus]|uniref:Extracellular solute-binding protein n=1 Tax=Streptomyces armeniacus TaxID=83291 RepID=A0A345XIX5_9ACTN|nr:extracellular solute-binding protein [Streptomyces armeniacus]AXK31591.1 extracellular solute-binding protein [Streptomyces armeniacus]
MTPPPALPRRRLLRGALYGAAAAAAAPALSACGSVVGSSAVTGGLQFWNLFAGTDGGLMKKMLTQVERRVPELRATSTVLEWGASYYTKLAMSSAGGRPPDLAVMHVSRLAGYAPGGLLDPWDMDTLAEFGIRAEDLNPDALKRGHYDGRPYALPLDTHPLVVYFDREAMDKAGLLDGDGRLVPFDSPEDYLDAAQQLRAVKGKMGPVYGHVRDPAANWRLFWTLFAQTGAEFDISRKPARIDRAAAVRVVRLMHRMMSPECGSMDGASAIGAFANGSSPMIFTGEWDITAFREVEGLDLGASPFPTLLGRPAAWADSHTFVLPHRDDPDPERRRDAHRLVAELFKASFTWAEAGHIPGYLPVVRSRAYGKLSPQSDYAKSAETPALDPPAWFFGAGTDVQSQMSQALQSALGGGTSADETVDRMTDAVEFSLGKPNPA